MATQTLYVRDEKLWADAKTLAGSEGLSGLIHDLLRTWVQKKEAEMESVRRSEQMREYDIVVVPPAHDLSARVVFTGRLLGDSQGFSVGQLPRIQVFETKGRKLVVYRSWKGTSANDQGATYQVYRDYEELAKDRKALDTMWIEGDVNLDRDADHSDELQQQVANALGKELIIRLD